MSVHRDIWTVSTGTLLAGALAILMVQPAATQDQDYDARWLPWLGCWGPVTETTDSDAPMLCLRPVPGGEGVEMLTVTGGDIVAQEAVRADGMNRETSREACEGWERASFSDDGRRVYLRTELTCEGGLQRNSTGLMSMASPYEWMDVRSVELEGESVPWVLRYQLATREAVEAAGLQGIAANRVQTQQFARVAASSPITIDDVVDASEHIDAKAVEAWVVERGDQFDLDASRLIALANAGVAQNVIDMVVAVSYPDHFVIDRGMGGDTEFAESDYTRGARYGGAGRARYGYGRYYDPFFYDPYLLSPFYSPYAGSGYYSPYGYGFGYGIGYGGYGFGYGGYGSYRPTVVVVGRRDQDAGSGSPRAVRGRGYTRGSGSSSSGSGAAARPPSSSSSGPSAAPSRSGPSSSGSKAKGRKARRRGGP